MPIQPRGKSGYVSANGLRLHYLEYGRGDVKLVIVPGITSPAITWEFVAEELGRNYHVYTMDVRGRGLSDKPASGHRLTDYAKDTADFIRALGLDRPVVLGHSMGARIAAAFGALHADVRGALVVVDPPLSGPGRAPYPSPLDFFVDGLRRARAGSLTVEALRPSFPSWTDEQLQIRADWMATCDETAVVETHRGFHEEDFFAYWRKLLPPVLLMYGGKSPAVLESAIEEIAAANPRAKIARVPDAGHMIPWDNLSGFLSDTRRFIDEVTR